MFNEFERETLKALHRIEHLLRHDHFNLRLEHNMAIGDITAGQSGTFTAVLLLNGEPYNAPSGSTYTFGPSYTSSDADITIGADGVANVPATSTDTSLTVDASAVAPDGTTVTAPPVTVTITPAPQVFSLGLSQTA
jgi:hypothetical protein